MAESSNAAPLRQTLSLSRLVFCVLLFFYFAFSSGELLYVVVGIYKPKIAHIIALIVLGWILIELKTWKLDRGLFLAFVFILASLMLSAVFGAAPRRSLGYVGVYLFNFVLYFFIPLQIMQSMPIQQFFRIYWSSFLFVGLYACLQLVLSIFGVYDPMALQRIGSIARGQAWTYEPSYYALYMIPYVMYHNAVAFLKEKTNKLFKLWGQNMLLVVSTSTGLIVSYPIFFTAIILKAINPFQTVVRKKLIKALLAFGVTLGIFTLLFYEIALNSLFKFFYFGFKTHASFYARWDGIVASVQTFLKHPILGLGLGGVSTERFQKQSTYDLKIETLGEFEAFDPTNCFTEVLASLGVVGLFAFIYLGVQFYLAFQNVIQNAAIDLETKKMATALFLSLVVMIVALQMNQGLFRPYVWIHAAVVYGFLFKVRAQDTGKLHHVDRFF